MRNQFDGLPAWGWLAVALSMLIAGLWLAYFLVVNRPQLQPGTVESVSPAATASPDISAQGQPQPAQDIPATPVTVEAQADAPQVDAPQTDTPATDTAQPLDVPTEAAGDELALAASPPAPTATPLPQPTETATPVPAQRLSEGMEQYRLGDYAAARAQFAALLASDATSQDVRLRAQYELAKSYIAEGLYADALSQVDQLQTQADLTVDTAAATDLVPDIETRAEYLRAEALGGLGRYDEAIAAYTRFLQVFPSTTATVQPKLGRMYFATGAVDAGDAAYRTAAGATADVVHSVLLLEELAQLHTDAGRHSYAAAAYDSILDVAQNPHYRAQIFSRAGRSYAAAGNETTAIERWQSSIKEAKTVYEADEATGENAASSAWVRETAITAAYDSLVELIDREVPFDLYDRGIIDLEAEAYLPAVNAFTAYLENVAADDARAADALHGLGRSHLGLGDLAAAQTTFERVLAEYPACDCIGEVKLDMAAVQALQGDGAGARRSLRTFARDNADHPLAPEAMWRSGISALNDGEDAEGAFDLLALVDAFPNSTRAPQALFWLGTGAFRSGLYSESAEALGRLQREYPDYRSDATAYWLGRAQRDAGNSDAATQTWSALVNQAPDTYYGILAAHSLRPLDLSGGSMLTSMAAIAGPATRLAGDDGSKAFADQWLANWLGGDPASMSVLPEDIADDADLQSGRLLLDLDARGDALEALERVYERYQENPQALYALSLEFERLGAYRLSLLAMSRLLQLSPANLVEDGPIFMQERIYPRPFAELITQQAIAHNLDPLLLFSLIRQESLFEEGARSVAAAQGLAQIIPDTGNWIAEQLGYPNYTNELVYRPIINVRFGAYYLDWVRDYLDGNIVSALVGYNAGPGNSLRWREMAGADDVRFVEILEFAEPRTYVRAIASNLYHYQRLYGQ